MSPQKHQDWGHIMQCTNETSFRQAVSEEPKRRQHAAANDNSSLNLSAAKITVISLPILATPESLHNY